jgi:hypothetical protein
MIDPGLMPLIWKIERKNYIESLIRESVKELRQFVQDPKSLLQPGGRGATCCQGRVDLTSLFSALRIPAL